MRPDADQPIELTGQSSISGGPRRAGLLASTIARLWSSRSEALAVLLLGALVVKILGGALAGIDLGLADEASYLARGIRLGREPMPPADASPLYSVWYFLLSVFERDPARLYYLNWCLLEGGLAAALYVLARRSGAPVGAAVLATTVWSLSWAPFVWPYVTYFSTLLLACTAIVATYVEDRFVGAILLALGLFSATFLRPELWWPSVLFATGCSVWAIRRATSTRRLRPVFLGAVPFAVAAGERALFGNPSGGDRAIFAFAQHYALNKVEAEGLAVDPWASYESLFRAAFPRALTLLEALRENPSAALWHVGRNLRLLPIHLADVGGIHRYMPIVPRALLTCALVAFVVAGGIGLFRARLSTGLARWLLLALPLAVAAMTSSLVVYPREHYLVPVYFVGLVVLASGTAWLGGRMPAFVRAAVPALPVLGLVLLPTYGPPVFPSLLEARVAPPSTLNKHIVETLRSLGIRRKVVIVESGWTYALYASLEFEHVGDAEKNAPFWSFVEERHVDVLVLDARVRNEPRFRDDPEFVAFLASASSRRDFVLVPVPGEDAFLAVRSDCTLAPIR